MRVQACTAAKKVLELKDTLCIVLKKQTTNQHHFF